MHEATPYGYLIVAGNPVSNDDLAALAALPPNQIPSLLDELEKAGVLTRNRKGVIYSQRFLDDEARAINSSIGGKKAQKNKQQQKQQKNRTNRGISDPKQVFEKTKENQGAQSGARSATPTKKDRDRYISPHTLTSFGYAPPCPENRLDGNPDKPQAKPPDKPAAKRGTRLPDDWQPSDADRAFAESKGAPNADIEREAGRFRDYWRAKPGASGRNWIRRLADQQRVRDPSHAEQRYQPLSESSGTRDQRARIVCFSVSFLGRPLFLDCGRSVAVVMACLMVSIDTLYILHMLIYA